MKIIAAILLALSFSASAETTYLYTEVSQPGETMDSFVVRISPRAYSTSWIKAKEVCGAIESTGGQFSIDIHQGTYAKCDFINPEGSIGFHTHPVQRKEPLRFSKADIKVGGYLAGRNEVMHSDGKGSIRRVD